MNNDGACGYACTVPDLYISQDVTMVTSKARALVVRLRPALAWLSMFRVIASPRRTACS
jgi:hypothetical protein